MRSRGGEDHGEGSGVGESVMMTVVAIAIVIGCRRCTVCAAKMRGEMSCDFTFSRRSRRRCASRELENGNWRLIRT